MGDEHRFTAEADDADRADDLADDLASAAPPGAGDHALLEANPADAAEQAEAVQPPAAAPPRPKLAAEVPEADALEQAAGLGAGEDDDYR